MNTARAMASLARSNPIDARSLAAKGRSPEARAALLGIFAAPAQPSAVSPPRVQLASSSRRVLLLLGTAALVAVLLLAYELPREQAPSLPPGPSVAIADQPGPADTEGRAWMGLPPSVYSAPDGFLGYGSPTPTLSPLAPRANALLAPGSTYLLTQIRAAAVVAVGTIAETSPTPSSGPSDPGYTTFRLEAVQTLLARADSESGPETPASGEEDPAEETLLFRTAGVGVEDVGHQGGLAPGDQVVFFGTRRSPTGERMLPGYWLLLGDYSAYKEEDGVFVRLAPVYDDPEGNSFTLPELETMLAPYGGVSP
ncbi:MAG: hypothetical protein ACYC6T_14265 [Thermoleophilia bacterium]